MREARCIEPSKPPAKGRSATFPPQARGCRPSPSLPRTPRYSGLTEQRIDVASTIEDAQDIDTRLAQGLGDDDAPLERDKPQPRPQIVTDTPGPRQGGQLFAANPNPADEGNRPFWAVGRDVIVE